MTRGLRTTIRAVLLLLALAAVLLAAAPSLMSRPAARNWLLARVLPLNGTITTVAVRWEWLRPVRIEGLEVIDQQGRRAVSVATIDGDRPLWRLVMHRSSPGSFRLEKVQFDLILEPEGTNFDRLIAIDRLRPTTLGLEVVDAMLVIRKSGALAGQIGPFQVGMDIKAEGPPSERELVVRPGRVLDKATITSPSSSELLQYAMPVLAEANLSGQLSLEVDGWRVPFFTPEKASGSGRLVIDRLDVEPGPLVRQLCESLGYAASIRLTQAMAVPVSMSEGRIYHRDLKFTLRNLSITSRGSVGVDQTLALVADVEFPRNAATNLPLLDAVQKVSIPIRGTLDRPEVDRQGLRESGKDLLHDAIDGLLRRGLKRTKQSS